MIGIPHGNNADTAFFCLFNGQTHGPVGRQLPHARLRIHHAGNRRFKHQQRLGLRVNQAFFNPFMIPRHPLHAMAFDAIQICLQQDISDDFTFLPAEAEGGKGPAAEGF